MQYVIDRFEEELAICENDNKETVAIEKAKLPDSAREGDVIQFQDSIWQLDTKETEARRKRIRKKMMDLFE